ncbi:MAG: MazG nucleotide pyrophosphohydrolase domain-containing protein [Promethearchaeota archaeon]|jgi:NTP pyrophosphatase (non-canonical NTP hydrolase)
MKISDFQELLKTLYLQKDMKRGVKSTFIWLIEEIGELAAILKSKEIDKQKASEEIADIIAWTISVGNILNVDVEEAIVNKYPNKCKKCNSSPCTCKK